jgi:hypothetical protein
MGTMLCSDAENLPSLGPNSVINTH